jgi:biopolymer transport protein TolR
VPVELPDTSAVRVSQPKKPMVVTLAADGGLYIRDEQVAPETFVGRLASLRAEEGDAVVYLRADKKNSYGAVMELLSRVGEGGYQRVSLLSQPSASKRSASVDD